MPGLWVQGCSRVLRCNHPTKAIRRTAHCFPAAPGARKLSTDPVFRGSGVEDPLILLPQSYGGFYAWWEGGKARRHPRPNILCHQGSSWRLNHCFLSRRGGNVDMKTPPVDQKRHFPCIVSLHFPKHAHEVRKSQIHQGQVVWRELFLHANQYTLSRYNMIILSISPHINKV